VGTELGIRHLDRGTRWELTLFQTDFSELLAPEIVGAGLTPSTNAGQAESYGIEALVSHDHGRAKGWGYGTPVTLSATFTRARFKDLPAQLSDSAGLFAGGVNGAEIPYVPEWKLGLSAGLEWDATAVTLSGGYSSSTWGTGYNERARATPSALDGRVPALLTLDLAFRHELAGGLRLIGGVRNLTDEREIISRAPLGPRANAPRTFHLGAEYRF
jgi:outer membrane receptor protein involved in Fe transport